MNYSDNKQVNYKDDMKKERKPKEEEFCVSINIFCDEMKKEPMYREDGYKDECEKEERKDEKSCVVINIFCDKCKKEYNVY